MKKTKYIIKLTIFFFILALCICKTRKVVQEKGSNYKYIPFFDQKADFDVLFMGSSHMINGVFPMKLWADFGIVSYNFGGHGNRLPTTYWVMENALEYTSPKLVVIDVMAAGSDEKVSPNSNYLHSSFDVFPVSFTKIRAVYDLFDNPDAGEDLTGVSPYKYRWEFIWDLGKYHSRWSEIKENDVTNSNMTREKGAESRIGFTVVEEHNVIPATHTMETGNTVGIEYLRRMIEDCQKRNIEVLLVCLPYFADENAQMEANTIYAIADEYGVNYINFISLNDIVNRETDYADSGHLNPSGARKLTEYLGNYIEEHYDIPDRRQDEKYIEWFEDYNEYKQYKIDIIRAQESFEMNLVLLADDDFKTYIYINEDVNILENEMICKLISNIEGVEVIIQKQADADIWVYVEDCDTGKELLSSRWDHAASDVFIKME